MTTSITTTNVTVAIELDSTGPITELSNVAYNPTVTLVPTELIGATVDGDVPDGFYSGLLSTYVNIAADTFGEIMWDTALMSDVEVTIAGGVIAAVRLVEFNVGQQTVGALGQPDVAGYVDRVSTLVAEAEAGDLVGAVARHQAAVEAARKA